MRADLLYEASLPRGEAFGAIVQSDETWYAATQVMADGWDPLHRPKVFGVGIHRTGTRSLQAALGLLGVHVSHWDQTAPCLEDVHRRLAAGRVDFELLRFCHGACDVPFPPLFAALDAQYPDALFVLTTRPAEAWLASVRRHLDDGAGGTRALTPEERMQYTPYDSGVVAFNVGRMRAAYEAHNTAVRTHFRGRPGKFLEIDVVSAGDAAWGPLCRLLGKPVPPMRFPHRGGPAGDELEALEGGSSRAAGRTLDDIDSDEDAGAS